MDRSDNSAGARSTAVAEITVFFPCHNEEANIERVTARAVRTLDRLGLDYEIILVDDGSTDRTGALADALAAGNSRIKVIHHERNLGYGCALQSGFRGASKAWVFYTDGDGQFDLDDLERLLPLAGKFDIVSGYRLHRRDNLLRRLFALLWGWLVRLSLGLKVKDVDSAFKLYRRELFDHIELQSRGALIDAEVLARAVRAGYTIGLVGVRHLPRVSGRSTGASPRVVLRAFKELVRLRKSILATPKHKVSRERRPEGRP